MGRTNQNFYIIGCKPILDFFISVATIILLIPAFLLIILAIKIDSRGPVFFKQRRVGKNLKVFDLLKFRSMTNKKHLIRRIVAKEEGVTKVGYWLRRYKIDELPQLFNVLKGEMSIVGPRPGVPSLLNTLSDYQKTRYNVKPGLTGLAQVSGNIYLSWTDRIVYDLKYINKVSYITDIRIIFRTILIIVHGEEKFIHKSLNL